MILRLMLKLVLMLIFMLMLMLMPMNRVSNGTMMICMTFILLFTLFRLFLYNTCLVVCGLSMCLTNYFQVRMFIDLKTNGVEDVPGLVDHHHLQARPYLVHSCTIFLCCFDGEI